MEPNKLFVRWPWRLALWSGRLLGATLLLAAGCSSPLAADAYLAYLTDPAHGLTHTREASGTTLTCTYRPTDLLVAQELRTLGRPATPGLLDSLRGSYAGKTYCALTLTKNGTDFESQFAGNPTTYGQVVSYLNTGIAADAFLVASPQDSVAAFTSFYPRQFGVVNHSTVLLIFNTPKGSPAAGFHFTLRGTRLGLNTLRFPFTASDLRALPALKF